jgi:O-acetyl-ADP-ribose deacetylase (regulator of RNase III)
MQAPDNQPTHTESPASEITPVKLHPRLRVHYGDIFDVPADAIVNAANSRMLGGGGIDGQIHKRAGPILRKYIKHAVPARYSKNVRCLEGDVVTTPGFRTGYHLIIHTVGPQIADVMPTELEEDVLECCYSNIVIEAGKIGCEHIVTPCIATGIYGYPMLEAARTAIAAIGEELDNYPNLQVTMAVFNPEEQEIWRKLTVE